MDESTRHEIGRHRPATEHGTKLIERRIIEDIARFGPESVTLELIQQLHDFEGGSAELVEVVRADDRLDSQNLNPDRRDHFLERRSRRGVPRLLRLLLPPGPRPLRACESPPRIPVELIHDTSLQTIQSFLQL